MKQMMMTKFYFGKMIFSFRKIEEITIYDIAIPTYCKIVISIISWRLWRFPFLPLSQRWVRFTLFVADVNKG